MDFQSTLSSLFLNYPARSMGKLEPTINPTRRSLGLGGMHSCHSSVSFLFLHH